MAQVAGTNSWASSDGNSVLNADIDDTGPQTSDYGADVSVTDDQDTDESFERTLDESGDSDGDSSATIEIVKPERRHSKLPAVQTSKNPLFREPVTVQTHLLHTKNYTTQDSRPYVGAYAADTENKAKYAVPKSDSWRSNDTQRSADHFTTMDAGAPTFFKTADSALIPGPPGRHDSQLGMELVPLNVKAASTHQRTDTTQVRASVLAQESNFDQSRNLGRPLSLYPLGSTGRIDTPAPTPAPTLDHSAIQEHFKRLDALVQAQQQDAMPSFEFSPLSTIGSLLSDPTTPTARIQSEPQPRPHPQQQVAPALLEPLKTSISAFPIGLGGGVHSSDGQATKQSLPPNDLPTSDSPTQPPSVHEEQHDQQQPSDSTTEATTPRSSNSVVSSLVQSENGRSVTNSDEDGQSDIEDQSTASRTMSWVSNVSGSVESGSGESPAVGNTGSAESSSPPSPSAKSDQNSTPAGQSRDEESAESLGSDSDNDSHRSRDIDSRQDGDSDRGGSGKESSASSSRSRSRFRSRATSQSRSRATSRSRSGSMSRSRSSTEDKLTAKQKKLKEEKEMIEVQKLEAKITRLKEDAEEQKEKEQKARQESKFKTEEAEREKREREETKKMEKHDKQLEKDAMRREDLERKKELDLVRRNAKNQEQINKVNASIELRQQMQAKDREEKLAKHSDLQDRRETEREQANNQWTAQQQAKIADIQANLDDQRAKREYQSTIKLETLEAQEESKDLDISMAHQRRENEMQTKVNRANIRHKEEDREMEMAADAKLQEQAARQAAHQAERAAQQQRREAEREAQLAEARKQAENKLQEQQIKANRRAALQEVDSTKMEQVAKGGLRKVDHALAMEANYEDGVLTAAEGQNRFRIAAAERHETGKVAQDAALLEQRERQWDGRNAREGVEQNHKTARAEKHAQDDAHRREDNAHRMQLKTLAGQDRREKRAAVVDSLGKRLANNIHDRIRPADEFETVPISSGQSVTATSVSEHGTTNERSQDSRKMDRKGKSKQEAGRSVDVNDPAKRSMADRLLGRKPNAGFEQISQEERPKAKSDRKAGNDKMGPSLAKGNEDGDLDLDSSRKDVQHQPAVEPDGNLAEEKIRTRNNEPATGFSANDSGRSPAGKKSMFQKGLNKFGLGKGKGKEKGNRKNHDQGANVNHLISEGRHGSPPPLKGQENQSPNNRPTGESQDNGLTGTDFQFDKNLTAKYDANKTPPASNTKGKALSLPLKIDMVAPKQAQAAHVTAPSLIGTDNNPTPPRVKDAEIQKGAPVGGSQDQGHNGKISVKDEDTFANGPVKSVISKVLRPGAVSSAASRTPGRPGSTAGRDGAASTAGASTVSRKPVPKVGLTASNLSLSERMFSNYPEISPHDSASMIGAPQTGSTPPNLVGIARSHMGRDRSPIPTANRLPLSKSVGIAPSLTEKDRDISPKPVPLEPGRSNGLSRIERLETTRKAVASSSGASSVETWVSGLEKGKAPVARPPSSRLGNEKMYGPVAPLTTVTESKLGTDRKAPSSFASPSSDWKKGNSVIQKPNHLMTKHRNVESDQKLAGSLTEPAAPNVTGFRAVQGVDRIRAASSANESRLQPLDESEKANNRVIDLQKPLPIPPSQAGSDIARKPTPQRSENNNTSGPQRPTLLNGNESTVDPHSSLPISSAGGKNVSRKQIIPAREIGHATAPHVKMTGQTSEGIGSVRTVPDRSRTRISDPPQVQPRPLQETSVSGISYSWPAQSNAHGSDLGHMLGALHSITEDDRDISGAVSNKPRPERIDNASIGVSTIRSMFSNRHNRRRERVQPSLPVPPAWHSPGASNNQPGTQLSGRDITKPEPNPVSASNFSRNNINGSQYASTETTSSSRQSYQQTQSPQITGAALPRPTTQNQARLVQTGRVSKPSIFVAARPLAESMVATPEYASNVSNASLSQHGGSAIGRTKLVSDPKFARMASDSSSAISGYSAQAMSSVAVPGVSPASNGSRKAITTPDIKPTTMAMHRATPEFTAISGQVSHAPARDSSPMSARGTLTQWVSMDGPRPRVPPSALPGHNPQPLPPLSKQNSHPLLPITNQVSHQLPPLQRHNPHPLLPLPQQSVSVASGSNGRGLLGNFGSSNSAMPGKQAQVVAPFPRQATLVPRGQNFGPPRTTKFGSGLFNAARSNPAQPGTQTKIGGQLPRQATPAPRRQNAQIPQFSGTSIISSVSPGGSPAKSVKQKKTDGPSSQMQPKPIRRSRPAAPKATRGAFRGGGLGRRRNV